MAIKIPRGSQPEVRLPTTNTLGVVANNPVSRSFNKLTEFLDISAQRIEAHKDKLRETEIKNFNTKNLSLLAQEIQNHYLSVEDDKNADTSQIWNNYNNFYDKTLQKYKKQIYKDKNEEWDRFVSDFHSAFNAGKQDLRLIRNNKIKGNAKVSFNILSEKFKKDINKLPSTGNIINSTKLLLQQFNTEQKYYSQIDGTLPWDAETYAYNSMYWKVATVGHKFTNKYDGEEYINFQDVYKEIRTNIDYKGIGFEGKIPEKYRTHILEKAKKGKDDQEGFFQDQQARLNETNGDPISKLIGDWINDDLHPKDSNGKDIPVRDYLESLIQNAESTNKITPKFAESLYTRIEGITTDKGKGQKTDSMGSSSSLNKYIDKIITGQWTVKDTINVQNDPTLEYKGKKYLMDFLKTWKTELNETKKMYIEEYIKTFENKITGVTGQMTELIGLEILDKQKFNATKAIRRIVAEGERAGISYYEMFENPNSKFYIPIKLDPIYNISISNITNIQNDMNVNQAFWKNKYNEALTHFVDADPQTEGQQIHQGYDIEPVSDAEGNIIGVDKVPIGPTATYYERYLNKPQPPNQIRKDGSKIPINEYENSGEYQKYLLEYAIWLKKGNFNTQKMPSIYKGALGYTDLTDKEKLENQ